MILTWYNFWLRDIIVFPVVKLEAKQDVELKSRPLVKKVVSNKLESEASRRALKRKEIRADDPPVPRKQLKKESCHPVRAPRIPDAGTLLRLLFSSMGTFVQRMAQHFKI